MEINDFLNLVPIQIVAIVFFGTLGAKKIFIPSGQKAPRWFPAVPFGIGFVAAILWYYNTTEPEIVKELPTYLKVIRPLFQAILSACVSIFAWEILWKKYLAKKFGDTSDPPTLPPGSPSPLAPPPGQP